MTSSVVELSLDQESQLIEALIALGWRKRLEGESCAAITQLLNCSDDKAKTIIEYLYIRCGLLRQVSSIGEDPDSPGPRAKAQWRWIAT
jgi:hypothetical protein